MIHGTNNAYVRGCRQECCRRAHTLYMNLYRGGRIARSVDSTGTIRRLQALQAIGWPRRQIAAAVGVELEVIMNAFRTKRNVWARTADLVTRAYDQLSMTPGPCHVVRRRALAKGWLPPLAWDDATIDDPTAGPAEPDDDPIVDEVLIQRAMDGIRVQASKAEWKIIVDRWRRDGRPIRQLDLLQGWNVHRDGRVAA